MDVGEYFSIAGTYEKQRGKHKAMFPLAGYFGLGWDERNNHRVIPTGGVILDEGELITLHVDSTKNITFTARRLVIPTYLLVDCKCTYLFDIRQKGSTGVWSGILHDQNEEEEHRVTCKVSKLETLN